MWWSGNQKGHGGVGVLVKEELYYKIVEVRRVDDRVVSLAMAFEEDVRVLCVFAPQTWKSMEVIEKNL